jgi:uncharacterized protein (DUF1501 family)
MTRRGFIQIGTTSIASMALGRLGLLPAMAQSGPDYRALVCVFLFGGNDSNNTVVPMSDEAFKAYTSLRGALALSGKGLTAPVSSVSNEPFAFHAALTDLANLFGTRELAVVANVGSLVQPLTRDQYRAQQAPIPSNLFSHSDQQLQWQTAVAQGRSATGWAGRAADYVAVQNINGSAFPTFVSLAGNSMLGTGADTKPVALAPGQSLQLAGFNSTAQAQARWDALNSLLNFDTGMSLVQAAGDTLSHSVTDAKALSTALAKATPLKTQFPKTAFASQLQQVAQMIQIHTDLGMRRQIFMCSLGGFDTHANEINTHNALYPQLNQGLAAFYSALQELGEAGNVTTFTESDFSRTFQPTSGGGSDHAWGSHHLVLGGSVQGGQVYGAFPSFQLGGPDDADVRGRWIPTTSIDQYGATLCSWFGIPDGALQQVFPNLVNFPTRKLKFLG